MRQTQQISSFSAQPSREIKVKRKLSLKPQISTAFDQLIENEDLKTIGHYIHSNIQSKRKSIMQLYSTTLSFMEQTEKAVYPVVPLSPNKKTHKKRNDKDLLLPLSPQLKHRHSNPEAENKDSSMIVSNKFPEKIVKPKIFLQRLSKLKPRRILKIDDYQSEPTQQTLVDKEDRLRNNPPLPPMPTKKNKTSLKEHQEVEKTVNQINPWEYLVIPEEPCCFNS